MAPYAHEARTAYYYGLPSRPNFVASSHTELWVPPTGPETYLPAKELRPVGEHKIADIWEAGLADRIILYLVTNKVKWTSLDVIRIGIVGKASAPIVLWIGVLPRSLSDQIGRDVALEVHKILQDSGTTDIHVEIRESYVIQTTKLLTPVEMPKSIAAVAFPLTSTLGVSVCTEAGQGTGGFYVTKSGVYDKVFLVTARHVISEPSLENNEAINYTDPGQPRHEVSVLEDLDFIDFLKTIEHEIKKKRDLIEDLELDHEAEDDAEESAEGQSRIEVAKKAIVKLIDFYNDVASKWDKSEERILDHVVLAPPIQCDVGRGGFTQDIAVIELDKSKIDDNNFLGNVIDIGTKIGRREYEVQMNPRSGNPIKFLYPPKRLLKISSVIPVEEMRRPHQLDKDGKECIMVIKNGFGSGTTIGYANGIFSYTRKYFGNDGITSKEWAIVTADPTYAFSTTGDSGSAIVDGKGRLGGLLTGGTTGRPAALDITYATPVSFVLDRLQEFGFEANVV